MTTYSMLVPANTALEQRVVAVLNLAGVTQTKDNNLAAGQARSIQPFQTLSVVVAYSAGVCSATMAGEHFSSLSSLSIACTTHNLAARLRHGELAIPYS